MKKSLILLTFLTSIILFSQKNENKVWDLLFKNNREEARVLFDKEFQSKKTSSFELLYLDALLDEELGQVNFDETFLKNFLHLDEDKNLIYPLSRHRFVIGDIDDYGFDDLTYRKVDFLAQHPSIEDENFIVSYKHALELNRKNLQSAQVYGEKFKAVTKWQRVGVFENLNGSGLDTEYEPEYTAANDKLFNAHSLGMVGWYNPKWTGEQGFQYLENEQEYEEGIVYAQSFVNNSVERRVLLETNINTEYKVFLNDVEIMSTSKDGYTNAGSHLVEVLLPKGTNRLLLKMALKSNNTAFMAVFYDKAYNKLPGLEYHDTYREYNKSTLQELQPLERALRFEQVLLEKIAQNTEKPFYKLLLAQGFLANEQLEQAKSILDELLTRYPNSTLLNTRLAKYHQKVGNSDKQDEIYNNIKTHDASYFMVPLIKMRETTWLESATVSEIEELGKLMKKTKAEQFSDLFMAVSAAKKRNLPEVKRHIQTFKQKSYNNESFFPMIAQLENIDQVGKSALIEDYKSFLEKRSNLGAMFTLVGLYQNSNHIDEGKKLLQQYIDRYPYLNNLRSGKIYLMADELQNSEVLSQIDEALSNFPYSFSALGLKAEILAKQNQKSEALKYAAKALSHNARYIDILNLQRDLNDKEDEIEKSGEKNFTKIISDRRNTKLKGSSGVTALLDEFIVNVYPEGGNKSRSTTVFEITSKVGIDEMKEYNVGYGKNILKAEIIKPNGTIFTAEKAEDQVVFTNIEVGDVLLIQTEQLSRSSGRFYKDFNLTSYFNAEYPVVESVFTLITPEDLQYQFVSNNGTVPSVSKTAAGKMYRTWKMSDLPELDLNENYSADYRDLAISVTANSIKSWKDIADWYADLTRKSLVYDKTTAQAFNVIFPGGVAGLSDYDKAENIYKYIQNHINYSSVDFRQSGYIPQKPAKTLITKLGDCKDLSTLFVILGKQAGITSNLVLVQTTNLEESNLLLPNLNFNHCIVQANLDGKTYFLEMTDKYLPFNSLVKSLFRAKALAVHQEKTLNSNAILFEIPDGNSIKNIYKTVTEVDFRTPTQQYRTQQFVHGSSKSFFNEFFTEEKTAVEKKKYFEETYGGVLNNVVNVKNANLLGGQDLAAGPLSFEVEYTVNESAQKIGNLQIVKIPFITKPFTKDVIATENRSTDIKYLTYEVQNEYIEEIMLILPESSAFIEIPKSEIFEFKNFKYSISYTLDGPAKLKIIRKAITPWDALAAKDYGAFKSFVEKILNVETQVVGFKSS